MLGLDERKPAIRIALGEMKRARPHDSGAIAAALQPYVDRGEMAGAVLLVADRDRVLNTTAVGWADLARKRPMTSDALFWIASITKPITGAALMMLVDEGRVHIRDPVESYLPEFAELRVVAKRTWARTVLVRPRRKPTLQHLLTHTSGMPMTSPLEKPTLDLLSLEVAARGHAMHPLLFHPGRRYAYSNAGINTVGRVMEVVSGLAYDEFLSRRLFRPLGMRDTTFVPSALQIARLARPHGPNATKTRLVGKPIPYLKSPLDDPSRQPVPGGGLFSTARDLARFAQMILRGGTWKGRRYLSRQAVRQMTRRHTPRTFEKGYGLGWTVEPNAFGHSGAFGSKMFLHPKHGLITIFLVQQEGWLGAGEEAHEIFREAAIRAYGSRSARGSSSFLSS